MNRAKEEIIKSILEALPDIKTRIRYKTGGCWNFNRYLSEAISMGLVEYRENRYFCTERGKQYLETIRELLVLSN